MRIKRNDYTVLQRALDRAECIILAVNPGIRKAYQTHGMSPMQYRWDLLRASEMKIGDSIGAPGDLNLYDYLDDTHIDTALRKITGTGQEWK